jgi:hypothetical protein
MSPALLSATYFYSTSVLETLFLSLDHKGNLAPGEGGRHRQTLQRQKVLPQVQAADRCCSLWLVQLPQDHPASLAS